MTANELIKLGSFRRAIELAKDKAQENLDHLTELEVAYDHLIYELIDANRQHDVGSIREALDD